MGLLELSPLCAGRPCPLSASVLLSLPFYPLLFLCLWVRLPLGSSSPSPPSNRRDFCLPAPCSLSLRVFAVFHLYFYLLSPSLPPLCPGFPVHLSASSSPSTSQTLCPHSGLFLPSPSLNLIEPRPCLFFRQPPFSFFPPFCPCFCHCLCHCACTGCPPSGVPSSLPCFCTPLGLSSPVASLHFSISCPFHHLRLSPSCSLSHLFLFAHQAQPQARVSGPREASQRLCHNSGTRPAIIPLSRNGVPITR